MGGKKWRGNWNTFFLIHREKKTNSFSLFLKCNMKISFITLGCKVNQYETNAMEQKFLDSGYEIVENTQKADVYVVNTCTVTNMSDRKSRQMLRRMKEQNKDAIVVACGCYV